MFVDGRYTIQAKQQSGRRFLIHEIPYVWPKDILNNYKRKSIGFDPKIFTKDTLELYFDNSCNLLPINTDLFRNKVDIWETLQALSKVLR